ncbi:hypothetical protein EDB19DRAFT_1822859 [Suillus lakei]|nr:hypothetical protein EDB19DRAFT_1822859 [Suillus lakei]
MSQSLQKPSLLSRIGARVDDPLHHVGLSRGNPQSYKSNPQTKQHVADSSFVDRVPATRQTTAFPPGTVTQEWNNHAYGILATVSISGSSAGSDIKPMSVDEGPLDSRQFRKRSSRMSVDPSSLTGTYRKASSRMSVDSSSPNVDQSIQRRASSRMSVDIPSTRRSRGSSGRMLIDEIQHHYPTQNLPQQAYSRCGPSFAIRPTVSPTMICSRNGEHTLASGALPPTSFPIQHMSLSRDRGSARGEANLASMLSSRPSSLQHGRNKAKQVIFPATSAPPRPCTSQPPPSLVPNSPAHPPGCSESSSVAPPGTFFQKYGTPASRQGNRLPSAKPDAVRRQSPTSRSRVRARGSSSGDNASYKRHCVRQDSQPIALLSIDSRPACSPSPQSPQSLSPIDEAWLPPMEKQLEMAYKSQLTVRFRKFKAIIGGAVNEIKQAIVPYHKDHRKRKVAHTNTSSEPFSGVPDYLRSLERYGPQTLTNTPQSQQRKTFGVGEDIDHIAQTWTKLALCDSPTALQGDDRLLPGEVPHLSLSLPRISEPPLSPSRSPPVRRIAGRSAVTQSQSDDEVEIYVGDAVNLAAPTFRRRRTADAFDANGVLIPRLPNNYRAHHR